MEDRGNAILGSVNVSSDKKHLMAEMMDDYSHFRYFAIEEESGSICDLSQGKGMQVEYIDTIDDCHYFISKEASTLGELLMVEKGQTLQQAKVVRAEKTEVFDGRIRSERKAVPDDDDNVSAENRLQLRKREKLKSHFLPSLEPFLSRDEQKTQLTSPLNPLRFRRSCCALMENAWRLRCAQATKAILMWWWSSSSHRPKATAR